MTETVHKTAVIGAAETTTIGKVPGMTSMMLAAEAAMNAMKLGIDKNEIDGLSRARWYLDGTGSLPASRQTCSTARQSAARLSLHVRHAVAALVGYCKYAW